MGRRDPAGARPAADRRRRTGGRAFQGVFGRRDGGVDASGNRLPYAPRFSFALGAEVAAAAPSGDATLFLQYRRRSRIYTGQKNEASDSIPGFGVLDARLSWGPRRGRLEFALWARNLADGDHLTNSVRDFLRTRTVSSGEPRTYGVELNAEL